jgi:hypothetical protein
MTIENLRPVEKKIGANIYKTSPLPARRGLRVGMKIARIIAPAFAALAGASSGVGNILDRKIEPVALGKAVDLLFEHLDDRDFDALLNDILASTFVNDREVLKVFDMHFANNYGELRELIIWVVAENFGSFFGQGGIGSLAASLAGAKTA